MPLTQIDVYGAGGGSSTVGSGFVGPTYKSAAPVPPPRLRMGDVGAAVVRLQSRLNALGYGPLSVDGIFGPATQDAALAFERRNVGTVAPDGGRVVVDGEIGPADWSLLLDGSPVRALAPPTKAKTPAPAAGAAQLPSYTRATTNEPTSKTAPSGAMTAYAAPAPATAAPSAGFLGVPPLAWAIAGAIALAGGAVAVELAFGRRDGKPEGDD